MTKRFWTCLCAAALFWGLGSTGRADTAKYDALRVSTLELNLGDASGHSRVLYNQTIAKAPLDTALARQNVAGIKEALASGLVQLQQLEHDAVAGSDQKVAKIYQEVRRQYDLASTTMQKLEAELAKASIDNQQVSDMTASIIKSVNRARKELNKTGEHPLQEPAAR